MDTEKQHYSLNNNSSTLPPAQLWVGQHEHVLQEVEVFLQKTLCPQAGCQTCITCMQIREKQHHAIMWFYPDKSYTIDQLEGLFTTINYSLQPREHFFFVIQKADFLTNTCANKLLKPMEEPPAGYHFILLAEHAENILPTIISRCAIHTIQSRTDNYTYNLLFHNLTKNACSPSEFGKIIDSSPMNERESVELFNEILHYWIRECNNITPDKNTEHIVDIISLLKKTSSQYPMPGSSSFFWRNMYLHMNEKIKQ